MHIVVIGSQIGTQIGAPSTLPAVYLNDNVCISDISETNDSVMETENYLAKSVSNGTSYKIMTNGKPESICEHNVSKEFGISVDKNVLKYDFISTLTKGQTKWIIKGRVKQKYNIIPLYGSGKFFTFDIMDNSAEIRVAVYDSMVDRYYKLIEVGEVYKINGGLIKLATKQFSPLKNIFEIKLTKESSITKCDNDPNFASINKTEGKEDDATSFKSMTTVKPKPICEHNFSKEFEISIDNSVLKYDSISTLTNGQTKWIVKARVKQKYNIIALNGSGKFFTFDIMDNSAEIRVAVFDSMVDRYYKLIEVGEVYEINGGFIKLATKQFSSLKNNFEIKLTKESTITKCDNDPNFASVNTTDGKEDNATSFKSTTTVKQGPTCEHNFSKEFEISIDKTVLKYDSISSLTNGQTKWIIKARVKQKYNIIPLYGSGKFFTFDIMDNSAEIRVAVYDSMVDRYYKLIEVGEVYEINGGLIKLATKQFSPLKNNYEIKLIKESSITKCDNDPNFASINKTKGKEDNATSFKSMTTVKPKPICENNFSKEFGISIDKSVLKYDSISTLTNGQTKWIVKARVKQKYDIIPLHGSGKFFTFDIMDNSGEIRVAVFDSMVDRYYKLIEVGEVYEINGGFIKLATKQFSPLTNKFEIKLTKERSTITKCDNDPNFAPIDKTNEKEDNATSGVVKYDSISTLVNGQTKWIVKARVKQKYNIIALNGSGKFFTFDIMDNSAEIRVAVFDSMVDRYFNLIEVGEIYDINGGLVKIPKQQFSFLNNNLEIKLTKESTITKCDNDPNFAPVNSMGENQNSAMETEDFPTYFKTSISELSLDQENWLIKGRVTNKSNITFFDTTVNENEKVFSFYLMDSSGEIEVSVSNTMVDKYYNLVEVGIIYQILGGKIKLANQKQNHLKHIYEIKLTTESIITKCDYDFTSIDKINLKKVNSIVDVIGIIDCVEQEKIFKKFAGGNLIKRTITLLDSSEKTVKLNLFDNFAKAVRYSRNMNESVVVAKKVKIDVYDGCRNLNSITQSKFEINPKIIECKDLRDWYLSEGKLNWVTLEDARTKTGTFKILGTIQAVLHCDSFVYAACTKQFCNKKLVKMEEGVYICDNCRKVHSNFKYQLYTKMHISDHTGCLRMTAFTSVLEVILGMTADEIGQKIKKEGSTISEITDTALFKQFLFTCMKKTTSNRVQIICQRAQRVSDVELNNFLQKKIAELVVSEENIVTHANFIIR